jgi:hypothetical protein
MQRSEDGLVLKRAVKAASSSALVIRTALPGYLFVWPVLISLVKLGAISLFVETELLLVDSRLLFYTLVLLLAVIRLLSGRAPPVGRGLVVLAVWLAGYLLSFIANAGHSPDWLAFNSGFLCFLAACLFVLICRDVIDWDLVVRAFALAMLVVTLVGAVGFLRSGLVHSLPTAFVDQFAEPTSDLGISSLSSSWSQQLWRVCGGKSIYVPAVIILFALYLRSIETQRTHLILNLAVVAATVSILVSGQRSALIALVYLGICEIWRLRSSAWIVVVVLVPLCLIEPIPEILKELYNQTFGWKLASLDGRQFSRVDIWSATVECLTQRLDYAVFGVSEGCLIKASGGSYWQEFSSNPHSLPLYVWASAGLLGVAALGALAVQFGVNAHRGMRLWRILFYWVLLGDLCFAGFGFYDDSVRSDLLNIALLIAWGTILGNSSERRPCPAVVASVKR